MLTLDFKPGSSLYYALWGLPSAKAQAVQALLELGQHWFNPTLQGMELSIAFKKLQWWQEEIERLFHGQPTHPLTLKLIGYQHYLPEHELLELLQQAIRTLQPLTPLTREALLHEASSIGGNLCHLVACILSEQCLGTLTLAREIGLSIYLTYTLRDCGAPTSLPIMEPNPEQVDYIINLAREHYKQAIHLLEAMQTSKEQSALYTSLLPLRLFLHLSYLLLCEIEKSPMEIFTANLRLSPFKKAWSTWKFRRNTKSMVLSFKKFDFIKQTTIRSEERNIFNALCIYLNPFRSSKDSL